MVDKAHKSKTMAISNKKPFSALLAILIVLQLNEANASDSLSFTFNGFGSDVKDIVFQGDALASNGTLQLTKTDDEGSPLTDSAGRAVYSAPVHLWDSSAGKLASFYTSFNFVIKPGSNSSSADGLTFFIAPSDSDIPSNSTGKYLALFDSDTALNTTQNQLVAVEFDTFANSFDPEPGTGHSNPHVGIDVNSIQSVTTAAWQHNSIPNGTVAYARIIYDSVSKNLRVFLSYPSLSDSSKDVSLSYVVDLRGVLPEWVRIGFSGSTGDEVETNNVLSWSFTSNLQLQNSKAKKHIDVLRSVL